MRRLGFPFLLTISLIACAKPDAVVAREQRPPSVAIYAEYARVANKPMKSGLNRRVFNIREAQHGHDITLRSDGCFTLLPGTYRLTGFSAVTMQTTMAPPLKDPLYLSIYEVGGTKSDYHVMARVSITKLD